jgi:DNA-directed RNA polymerase subunit RPC12/RpoP
MIPTLGHYVAYYITNAWSDFVLAIAETYEKPKAVLTPLPEAVLKSLTSAEENASFDTLTGRALFDDSTSRPISLRTRCPYCSSAYNLYLPSDMKVIRCPSCNLFYGIQKPNNVSAPAVA